MKTKKITIRLSDELHTKLRIEAVLSNTSVQVLVEELIKKLIGEKR